MIPAVVYYAAPLFTDAERAWNAANARTLRELSRGDIELLVPQEFCAALDAGASPDFARIFAACVAHLDRAQVVIAVLDGADPDSGTCWEAGYAYAKGIPVIGLRTDWRPAEDGPANCMLTRSCVAVVASLDAVASAVAGAVMAAATKASTAAHR